MHRLKAVLVLGAALAFGAVSAYAQDQPAQGEGGGHHHKGGGDRQNPDKMAARMAQQLNLSADQTAQLKPILAERQQQVQALRSDSSLSEDDRRAKAKQIMTDSNGKIMAILNDQQKQQFQQMQSERMAKAKAHKEGSDNN